MRRKKPTVHLINRLENAAGGSEWRTINLYRTLKPYCNVKIWTSREPDHRLPSDIPVHVIDVWRLRFPKSGTLVFIGVYFAIGKWIWLSRARRVIIVYNTPHLTSLMNRVRRLSRAFRKAPEIVYPSERVRREAGLPGIVELSLFNLDEFKPEPRPFDGQFVIGRLSRPNPIKHHPDDFDLYSRLARAGCRVRVMGASDALLSQPHRHANVELLASCEEESSKFLQGLDCFFYRTDPSWVEPWGRVVCEAMACGLTVVVERRGGYAEIIEHGVNGFLFDTEEEAFALLVSLRDDPNRRRVVGEEARATIAKLMSEAAQRKIVDYYLGSHSDAGSIRPRFDPAYQA